MAPAGGDRAPSDWRERRDGCQRRRAGHPLRAAVQRARPGRRRGLEQRQQQLRSGEQVPLGSKPGHPRRAALCSSWGVPELQAAARGETVDLVDARASPRIELKLRFHAGLGAASARAAVAHRQPNSRPAKPAANGGEVGAGACRP